MQELLAIMETMARLLASGMEQTLENVVREIPLNYDLASASFDKTGDFHIDGVLGSGVAFSLTCLSARERMLMIWFRDGYEVEGRVAELTPSHGKRIHPSPRDDGYLVAYDLPGVNASFLVDGNTERISLMTCKGLAPEPQAQTSGEMTQFDRLMQLLGALRRQNVPCRLDRHAPDEVTVTFVWADQMVEYYFDEDGGWRWFSHFQRAPEVLDADGVMQLIDDCWRDVKGVVQDVAWAKVADPFARMLAFTRMLNAEGITWRMDTFDGKTVRFFMTLVGARLEACADADGLTFTAYMGSEEVLRHEELAALVPGLSLGD